MFKGYDWTELSDKWGISLELEDEILAKQTKDYMLKNLSNPKVAEDIREFLIVLIKEDNEYSHSVWQGLLNITNDIYGNETLIKFTVELLECMWS